jgi:hypothetical protein
MDQGRDVMAGGSRIAWVHVLLLGQAVIGQDIVLDAPFDAAGVPALWTVVAPEDAAEAVVTEGGHLVITSTDRMRSGALLGAMTDPHRFPLFRRPTGNGEYNVYFFGVRLPDRPMRAALGLYSIRGTDRGPRLPRGPSDAERMSYGFLISAKAEHPNAHWVSTAMVADAGAAADSTGPTGFHVWEYGKVYDFRIQVTRNDVTWWGRVQPNADWMMLQDPGLGIGYPGQEPGGRNRFGLYIAVEGAAAASEDVPSVARIAIDRVFVTHYEPRVVATLLDCDFRRDGIDRSIWNVVTPEVGVDRSEAGGGRPLRIVSAGNGAMWSNAAGIWTRPDGFPLFARPKNSNRRVHVDFLGVMPPSKKQRCAMGLYSVNPKTEHAPKFPDDLGPSGGLAYAFWVLPDNDRLIENSNQLRAAVTNEKYAATDNYHHAWIWPFTERRDLRLEVTSREVTWYFRKDAKSAWRVLRDDDEFFYRRPAVPEDRNTGYWRPLYDPAIQTGLEYNGKEPNGRSSFGVFVHVSAAGEDGPLHWDDGDLRIDAIRATVVENHRASNADTSAPRATGD